MYCKKCGKEINDNAAFCPYCGAAADGSEKTPAKRDGSSFWWGLLGFLIPLVGLILYIVWRNDYPLRAKSAGKGALAGVIAEAACIIIYVLSVLFIVIILFRGSIAPVAACGIGFSGILFFT